MGRIKRDDHTEDRHHSVDLRDGCPGGWFKQYEKGIKTNKFLGKIEISAFQFK